MQVVLTRIQPTASRTKLLRSAVRFVETYVRSPIRGPSTPHSAQPLSNSFSQDEGGNRSETISQRTHYRLQIYNDDMSALTQPRTPQHLPEARHQSRLIGSYTAPLPRPRQRSTYDTGNISDRRDRPNETPGMETPGFRGLYGGVENADDSALYQDATRFLDSQEDEAANDAGI